MDIQRPRPLKTALFTAISVVLLTAAATAVAQQRLPGVIDRPVIDVPDEIQQPEAVEPAPLPEKIEPENPDQLVATLNAVTFDGTLILDEPELQKVVAPFLNRPLTTGDIAQLKYELTKRYYADGYVLVKVATPPQELSDGVLNVVIYTGRIGSLEVESDIMAPSIAESISQRIVKGDVFREGTVESVVKDLDDLENIKAHFNLRPGTETGTTDLKLIIEEVDESIQIFTLDNYGSELTGTNVAALNLSKGNLMGRGETLGLELRASDEDLYSVRPHLTMPLPFKNLTLEMDYLYSENEIGDFLSLLEATGETNKVGIALSSAILNQRQQKATVRAGVDVRHHESWLADVPETDDKITQLFVEGTYIRRAPQYVYYTGARLSKGADLFGANSTGDSLASRTTGDPEAWILTPYLFGKYLYTPNDAVQIFVQGQMASGTLLSSDLFIAGGYGSVRGFEPAQTSGESGASVNVEYQHQFNNTGNWIIKAGPFYDWGTVSNKISGAVLDSTLDSTGIALEARIKTSDKMTSTIRGEWAHTLGSYTSNTIDDDTFYVRYTQSF